MQMITITDSHIKNIVNSLTIQDDCKNILNRMILEYDTSYVSFLYSLFRIYTNLYLPVTSGEVWLDQSDMNYLRRKTNTRLPQCNLEDIVTCDRYDLIYNLTSRARPLSGRVNSCMYDDVYSRIAEMVGDEKAHWYMEEVFESIEFIMTSIESVLFRLSSNQPEETTPTHNVFIYVDFVGRDLNLVLI